MKKAFVPLLLLIISTAADPGDRLLRPGEAVVVDPEHAFRVDVMASNASTLAVRFSIADCCYLYRSKIHFSVSAPDGAALPGGPHLGTIQLPAGETATDEFFGRTEIYRRSVDVRLPLHDVAGGQPFVLNVTYQGCAEKGVAICYEPITRRFPVDTDEGQRLVIGSPHPVPR